MSRGNFCPATSICMSLLAHCEVQWFAVVPHEGTAPCWPPRKSLGFFEAVGLSTVKVNDRCVPSRSGKADPVQFKVRAACLQNETAAEKLLNRYEKRFEKREKGSDKTIRNASEKNLAPLRPLKNILPEFFNKL